MVYCQFYILFFISILSWTSLGIFGCPKDVQKILGCPYRTSLKRFLDMCADVWVAY